MHTPLRFFRAPALALVAAVAACGESPASAATLQATQPLAARSPDGQRQYGPPVTVGRGRARTYVVYDNATGNTRAPIEVGVALDEGVMDGLPGMEPMSHRASSGNPHDHGTPNVYVLSLPPGAPAPYRFVAFDWNPAGHVPPGVYDIPHFDVHFWTASEEERAAIVPTNPDFARFAARLPNEAQVPPSYVVAAPPGTPPEAVAVPLMGVHWADMRSPELQPPESPAHKAFTTTMLWGSWNGRFVFIEPMITRAYLLAKKSTTDAAVRDELLPLEMPAEVAAPGYYPGAYRITWDGEAREYRIALTTLSWRE